MTMMTSKKGDVLGGGQTGGLEERGAEVLPSEVTLRGRLEEVSWRTRTACLYMGDDDAPVTVRFTADQDGWLRLVANYDVEVHGTARYDAGGGLLQVELLRLHARDDDWQTHDISDQMAVSSKPPVTVSDIKPTAGFDGEKFMQSVRDLRAQKPW